MIDEALILNILITGAIVVAALVLGTHLHRYYCARVFSVILSVFLGVICIIGIWSVSIWYYKNTESGREAVAKQYNNTTKKIVEVYDTDGNLVNTYVIVEESQ